MGCDEVVDVALVLAVMDCVEVTLEVALAVRDWVGWDEVVDVALVLAVIDCVEVALEVALAVGDCVG